MSKTAMLIFVCLTFVLGHALEKELKSDGSVLDARTEPEMHLNRQPGSVGLAKGIAKAVQEEARAAHTAFAAHNVLLAASGTLTKNQKKRLKKKQKARAAREEAAEDSDGEAEEGGGLHGGGAEEKQVGVLAVDAELARGVEGEVVVVEHGDYLGHQLATLAQRQLVLQTKLARFLPEICGVGEKFDTFHNLLTRIMEMDDAFLQDGKDHEHDSRVSSVGIDIPGEVIQQKLNDWISWLLKEKGTDLFRSKGVLAVKGMKEKFVFQAIHMLFANSQQGKWEPDEEKRCKMVFIGKNLNREELTSGFMKCMAK